MNWDILTRALTGDISEEERNLFTGWLSASEANRSTWKSLQARHRWLNGSANEAMQAAAWQKLQSRLKETPIRSLPRTRYWWRAFAACAAVFIGFFLVKPLFRSQDVAGIHASDRIVQIACASTERKRLQLPDGSVVWLHYHSSLSFDSTLFNKEKREVVLAGDAFFEVAKNKQKPFIITAGKWKIDVVGTSFGVYMGSPNLQQVKVATGIVQVRSGKIHERLVAGNMLRYDLQTGKVLRSNTSIDEASALKNNTLLFANDNLVSITRKLEQWYRKKVIISGNAPEDKVLFTGVVHDDGIETVMKGLAYMVGFAYKIEDKEIIIYPQH